MSADEGTLRDVAAAIYKLGLVAGELGLTGQEGPEELRAAVRELRDDRKRLLEALDEAVDTIKAWHGDGEIWELYQHSPEMQRINAARDSARNHLNRNSPPQHG